MCFQNISSRAYASKIQKKRMASCGCRPFKISDPQTTSFRNYQTSYNRAHYHENVIDHPLNHLRVNRESRKDLRIQDAVMLELNKSTYNRTFDVQYWADRKPQDSMNRFSFEKANLKSLHEKYMKDPVRPMKCHESTTAHHYTMPDQNRAPLCVPCKSPIEELTCPIRALGRDEFPSVPVNLPGYSKHLDIFVSTTQLAHPRFTMDQQNGVARKDIRTFYDIKGTPKCRGFGPKKTIPIGAYFSRDKTTPDNVRLRSMCRVPYFGKTSEYKDKYDHGAMSPMHQLEEIPFPTIFPVSKFDVLSVPAMYCTENCHIGTGWPVKASVDIGKVKGTF